MELYTSVNPKDITGIYYYYINWKDQCWSWSSNVLATRCEELIHWERWKTKGEGRWQRMRRLDSIDSMNMNLNHIQEMVRDRGAAVHGVTKSQTWLSNWTRDLSFPRRCPTLSQRVITMPHPTTTDESSCLSTSLPTVDILCIYVFYFSLHVLFYKNNFFLRLFKERPMNIKMSWPLYDWNTCMNIFIQLSSLNHNYSNTEI